MPFHHMLFKILETPAVVLTSGNIPDEPVITDDNKAEERLGLITDSFLSYNRTVVNRTDDSVVRIIDRKISLIRRSRGYVPRPVDTEWDVNGILSLGAEQKNSFCIGKGKQALMSQHIGDLKNPETFGFFIDTINRFGLPSLLPDSVKLLSGPGCPVCVTGTDYIDKAIAYSGMEEFIICTFGDLLRVPGTDSSLEKMRAGNCIE